MPIFGFGPLFFLFPLLTEHCLFPAYSYPDPPTPCLNFNLALSVAGNLFHPGFHAHDTTTPAVSINPYPVSHGNPSDSIRDVTTTGSEAPEVMIWFLARVGQFADRETSMHSCSRKCWKEEA
ncbi:uncharacterized protein LOC112174598 [Rosa chinensis]|uniref:uncharacterized protein LOC112174598 n=1 Tax=Rosa chinensis TaxID=74649 RepID=UPI000D088947|nr:uncharacterized protein LOC112174598 [Rosa chinensis]